MRILYFIGFYLMLRVGRSLKCYECNIYEDRSEAACPVVDCPNQYNSCVTTTYTPINNISSYECYDTSDNGVSYRGTWNTNVGSSPCLNWEKANHTYNPTSYPNIGLGDHNHCRNPDKDVKPWCYTSKIEEFGYCDLPECYENRVKVVRLNCGWSPKKYCKKTELGETCGETCDTDLCNKPAVELIEPSVTVTVKPHQNEIECPTVGAAKVTEQTTQKKTHETGKSQTQTTSGRVVTDGTQDLSTEGAPSSNSSMSEGTPIHKDTKQPRRGGLSSNDKDGDGGGAAMLRPPIIFLVLGLFLSRCLI